MALSAKLELRQGQQLVMTPQLQQAIRLLQLSNMELGQFVETELERNPLLEMDEAGEAPVKGERDPELDAVVEAKNGAGRRRRMARSGQAGLGSQRRTRYRLRTMSFPDTARPAPRSDGRIRAGPRSASAAGSFTGDDINPEAFVSSEPSLTRSPDRTAAARDSRTTSVSSSATT